MNIVLELPVHVEKGAASVGAGDRYTDGNDRIRRGSGF